MLPAYCKSYPVVPTKEKERKTVPVEIENRGTFSGRRREDGRPALSPPSSLLLSLFMKMKVMSFFHHRARKEKGEGERKKDEVKRRRRMYVVVVHAFFQYFPCFFGQTERISKLCQSIQKTSIIVELVFFFLSLPIECILQRIIRTAAALVYSASSPLVSPIAAFACAE